MSMLNPRPGDVFILRDYEYNKREGELPSEDVKTIRFDRPVIVLSVQKDIVTIIPMTTHYERHYAVYKLQIQHGITSGALLSQTTTVEVTRLDNYIGKLKSRVTDNIIHAYFNYIEKGVSRRRPIRTISRLYNELDICRYFSFHIYMDKNTNELFMCIKSLKDHFYFIPVLKNNVRSLDVATVCGYLDFDNMWMLTDKDYNEDLIDMGEEYRSSVRNTINHEVNIRKGMKIYTKLYIDTFSDVSWAVHELFGQVQFINTMTILKHIIRDSNLQKEFLKNPKKLLPESKSTPDYKNNDMRMQCIKEHIMTFVDPLNCDLDFLIVIKNRNKKLFENLISPFKGAIYFRPDSKRMFDGDSLYNNYRVDNMRYIAEYFRDNASE